MDRWQEDLGALLDEIVDPTPRPTEDWANPPEPEPDTDDEWVL